jgi:hypothetical protein
MKLFLLALGLLVIGAALTVLWFYLSVCGGHPHGLC